MVAQALESLHTQLIHSSTNVCYSMVAKAFASSHTQGIHYYTNVYYIVAQALASLHTQRKDYLNMYINAFLQMNFNQAIRIQLVNTLAL